MCTCNKNGFTKKIKLSNKDYILKVNKKYTPDYEDYEDWDIGYKINIQNYKFNKN